jgi:hypothetical protein
MGVTSYCICDRQGAPSHGGEDWPGIGTHHQMFQRVDPAK